MAKSKLKTPDWILAGCDSPEEYAKKNGKSEKKKSGKTFKIRECPKCRSDDVNVLLTGEEGKSKGEWECKKCGWVGKNISEKALTEDEFIEYMEKKEEGK